MKRDLFKEYKKNKLRDKEVVFNKENPYIKREDLRYVKFLHHDFDGNIRVGEMICNKAIAAVRLSCMTHLSAVEYKQMMCP